MIMKLHGVQVNYIILLIGVNCENVYKYLNVSHSIKCTCGIKFCYKCREEKHYPIPCDILKKVLKYQ